MGTLRLLSFVVEATEEVFLSDHFLSLGPGTNAFTVTVGDREAFRQQLREAGCTIRQEYALDEHVVVEPLPEIAEARQLSLFPADLILPTGGR